MDNKMVLIIKKWPHGGHAYRKAIPIFTWVTGLACRISF